jgi:hypothetical protein
MFLNLDIADVKMKLVYELAKELKEDPEHVRLAQELTLNPNRPHMGLKGKYGLFGSADWWQNISIAFGEDRGFLGWWNRITRGQIKVGILSGTIESTYFAGQDSRWGDQVNSFDLKLADGSIIGESIYPKLKSDRKLFVPGAVVLIAYAFDELKAKLPNGDPSYSKTVLEMAVSTKPTTK